MNRTVVRHTYKRLASRKSLDIGRRYAHAPAVFNWEDPLNSANLFTEDELAIQETAHSYCQERMLPRVLGESRIFSRSKLLTSLYKRLTAMNTMTKIF